jgi:hypothetical protein
MSRRVDTASIPEDGAVRKVSVYRDKKGARPENGGY